MCPMSRGLRCWEQAKLMLELALLRCPVLLVQLQRRHLIWSPLPQPLTRRPALQARLAVRHRENR